MVHHPVEHVGESGAHRGNGPPMPPGDRGQRLPLEMLGRPGCFKWRGELPREPGAQEGCPCQHGKDGLRVSLATPWALTTNLTLAGVLQGSRLSPTSGLQSPYEDHADLSGAVFCFVLSCFL